MAQPTKTGWVDCRQGRVLGGPQLSKSRRRRSGRVARTVVGGEKRSGSQEARQNHASVFTHAERETLAVQRRIDEQLAKVPHLEYLARTMGGLLFFAGQRLIERRNRTNETRPKDEAIIYLLPRLFNECFAGYQLAKSGLALQAVEHCRTAHEILMQCILFLEDEEAASAWLGGKKLSPGAVRQKSEFAERHRELYGRLSDLTHPNFEALEMYSVEMPDGQGTAHAFGGGYFPKRGGQAILNLVAAELTFLDAFYEAYEAELRDLGLLWRTDVAEAIINPDEFSVRWRTLLELHRHMLHEAAKACEALPDVAPGFTEHLGRVAANPIRF